MKYYFLLAVALFIGMAACQPADITDTIYITDGEISYTVDVSPGSSAATALAQAGISLQGTDRLLLNGLGVAIDQALPGGQAHLEIWRAQTVTIITPDSQITFETSAKTVGQALREMGLTLYSADKLSPPAHALISETMTIIYTPSRVLNVQTAAGSVSIRSAEESVGGALASGGIPLVGLDSSIPGEAEPLPADGQIRITRIQEAVVLFQKPLPYQNEFVASADVDLDTQELLQQGEYGLSISRVRVRYEDGQETVRLLEGESVVRPPRNRILGYGTKITIRTESTPDGTIEYWRKITAWATSYKPCGGGQDRCYYGTSSGKPVQKGVIAVRHAWYIYMAGDPVYIPGYGFATIEDVGALNGKYWVDLGYAEDEYVPWAQWVTVYFLTPVPANIMYVLD